MTTVAIAQNMSELAHTRNQQQLTRLEKIKEYSSSIYSILESPTAFVTTDIMKEASQKAIIKIQKDLKNLMSEAKNHVMWLKWQINTIPAKELNPMIAYIEPETDKFLLSANEVLNRFNRLQK